MPNLRSKMIRMASELPQGDPTRRKLLAAVQSKTAKLEMESHIDGSFFQDLLKQDAKQRAVQYAKQYNRGKAPEDQIEVAELFPTFHRSGRDWVEVEYQDGASMAFSVIYEFNVKVGIHHP